MKLGRHIRKILVVGLMLSVTFLLPLKLHAEVPHQISYQGYLTDDLGNPLDGDYLMIFSIYDVPNGGTALWSESQGNLRVTNGIFNVHLGLNPTGNPFPDDLFDGELWLGVAVESDLEMVPRQLLTSTPFAKKAEVADRVENGVIETIHLANDAVTGDKIDSGAVSSSHLQDGAAINEIKDDDGAGSGLDADTLDGQQGSYFVNLGTDYGRSNVTNNLYEGTTTLTNKYVNQTGDSMTGSLTASVIYFGSGWREAIKGSLLGGDSVGAGVYGYSEGLSAHGVHGGATGAAGVGVYGEAANTQGFQNYGGYFTADGSNGMGVYGQASGAGGTGVYGESTLYGLYGKATGSTGRGVYGIGPRYGMVGNASDTGSVMNYGGYFLANGYDGIGTYGSSSGAGGEGIHGTATGNYGRGVVGEATYTRGTTVYGGHFTAHSTNGRGVYGESKGETGRGVFGWATNAGDVTNYGGYFRADGKYGRGVYAEVSGAEGRAIEGVAKSTMINEISIGVTGVAYGKISYGVGGISTGSEGIGVLGETNGANGHAVEGFSEKSSGYAGYFIGRGYFSGYLEKPGGGFKIDHPLEPENKYLNHSFVESPDMMNIYNGNVVLNNKGEAWVELPDWFETLNKDFRYQLTCIGGFAQVYIAEKVSNNRFKIAGGQPNMEISWQVTGIRQDPWANANRLHVEEDKTEKELGYYMHPEVYGQPEENNIEWARNPERMRLMKEEKQTSLESKEPSEG